MKVIFWGLGPKKSYKINDIEYYDGDIVDIENDAIVTEVITKGFAVPYSKDVEKRIKKSLEYADKKRIEIKKKVERLMKED